MEQLAAQLSLWGFPGDLAILAILVVGLLAFGLSGGPRFSMAFLIGTYVSVAIIVVLPALRGFLLNFGMILPLHTNAIAFLVSVAFVTWLLSGNAVGGLFKMEKKGFKAWWQVSVASILGVGLFTVLFFPLLPGGAWAPSALLQSLFLSDPMPFLWVVAPILFFVALRTDK